MGTSSQPMAEGDTPVRTKEFKDSIAGSSFHDRVREPTRYDNGGIRKHPAEQR
jgi:hypothetical protein